VTTLVSQYSLISLFYLNNKYSIHTRFFHAAVFCQQVEFRLNRFVIQCSFQFILQCLHLLTIFEMFKPICISDESFVIDT